MLGFYRFAAAVPRVTVGDVHHNVEVIRAMYQEAVAGGASAVVFPELSITGYTCGDLFFQPLLQKAAVDGAVNLAKISGDAVLVFGLPLLWNDVLYNVAAVAQNGQILALVPKKRLPNYREFYEKRQFTSGDGIFSQEAVIGPWKVPFSEKMVLADTEGFSCGIEICEDLWCVQPPSSTLALGGALAIFNLSAGTELAAKAVYRKELVRQQSARTLSVYVLASAGVYESTTDAVFSGHSLICENGKLAAESKRFQRKNTITFADVDLSRLRAARLSESSFADCCNVQEEFCRVTLAKVPESSSLRYTMLDRQPFVPKDVAFRRERCREIIDIQCAGLAKRMEHSHANKLVIGISGGLDSTLALLVAAECCKLLQRSSQDILAVTMPGFGTTSRTGNNAVNLCRQLGTTLLTIPIAEACLKHFEDIGHDRAVLDTTYENVQARERTQILMDLANKHGGLVVGTGDLSEIALGWSTYNGDHMSMYAVNASIPKTLIRFLIETVAEDSDEETAATLRDIIDTPVSPELLPPSEDGTIAQETEQLIGPYELHDFFLYHFIKYAAEPAKIFALAKLAFQDVYSEELMKETLKKFFRRFFQQQFKRSCMPDGPKVGTIALSPRGDWRMPSDASAALWLDEVEKL